MTSQTGRTAVSAPSVRARRARGAVSALFLLNGAIFANVVPRYPEVKDRLGLSNAELGIAIAGMPVGALVLGLAVSPLIKRFGSARVAVVSVIAMALNLILIGLAPSWGLLIGALVLAGGLDAYTDVANNAHGLRVQRLYGRSILNAFHGLWSVGAVLGGLMGALAAQLHVPLIWHLGSVMIIFVAAALGCIRFLLDGPESAEREPAHDHHDRAGLKWSVVRILALLGLVAAASAMIEDSGASWSAVYLRDSLDAIPVVAGLGFVVLQGAQTLGRLLGDRFVTRFGDRAVARVGGLLVVLGMGLALAVPSIVTTVIGFGLAGAGISTLIPAAMHAADNVPGLWPGAGLTAVAQICRVGFLAAPPLIGFIADASTLRIGLLVIPAAGLLVVLAAGSLPRRSTHPQSVD